MAHGRIVAVGAARDIRALAGTRTRTVELPGAMILPGFQDAHVHPTHGGLDRIRCDLHDVRGADAVLEAVRAYAAAHPDVPWILGGGWYMADFPGGTPSRHLLDAAMPDRPVFLANRDVHGAWANTRALEALGIGVATPDPPNGRIEREPDGTPQGTLHEGAFVAARARVPAPDAEEMLRALLAGQAYLHGCGITAWQDAWVAGPDFDAYALAIDRGLLTARVRGALWWDRDLGFEQVATLVERREAARALPGGRFVAGTVKVMADGVFENGTAAMLDPYLDVEGRPTGGRGLSFLDRDTLREAAVRLDALGFQVHVHAIGDRAVRDALDAFEAAIAANGRTDSRHHVAHIQVVHPADVPRFAALDVTATMQPFWACRDAQMTDLTIPFLGAERTAWQYPFGSLLRAGARLAGGSDWSVSTASVVDEIQVAVTRTWPDPDVDPGPLLPGEAIDVEAGLRAFTAGAAWVDHLDASTGTLAPGMAADVVVLDRDLRACEPAHLRDARVLLTLVEGQPVFAAPGHGW
ncbi:MAG: amidohydrolase [Chloroflexi bacterium]|nr:amidohydrolase [Chloroflexota bacterium]